MLKHKKILAGIIIGSLITGSLFYFFRQAKKTDLEKQGPMGEFILKDFSSQPIVSVTPGEDNNYQIQDTLLNGVTLTYANSSADKQFSEKALKIDFPKNYNEPINIKLDEQRVISITDKSTDKFSDKLVTDDIPLQVVGADENGGEFIDEPIGKITSQKQAIKYLKYQDDKKRKTIYYSYQKGVDERKLKNWIIYNKANNQLTEKEAYQISQAKIRLGQKGEVEVFYLGEQAAKNQEAIEKVEPSLLDRAQKTLQRETGEDILSAGNNQPDFVIPAPYYLNKKGERTDLKWEIDQVTNTISVSFQVAKEDYPVALDPTLSFIAPGQEESGEIIDTTPNNQFGATMLSGDLNGDGKTDLIVGSGASRTVHIFYNNNLIASDVGLADATIEGLAADIYFGSSLGLGDFNNDGQMDLAVGAYGYTNNTGSVYLFYNDGQIATSSTQADWVIVGEANNNRFGYSLVSGDFNADNKTDLAIGAYGYNTNQGRVYLFYNDGAYPNPALSADKIITGEAINNYFSYALLAGDFNNDNRVDLVANAYGYSSSRGRVYIFYNDSAIPSLASDAEVKINGELSNNRFGWALVGGDFDGNNQVDLAVGAYAYNSSQGRAYIFLNDGQPYVSLASAADKTITGEVAGSYFGYVLTAGDLNNDTRADLVVGAHQYNSNQGRAYVFQGSTNMPSLATEANDIITGENSNDRFSYALVSGDFNADNKPDLAVGAYSYKVNQGRAYIFYNATDLVGEANNADIKIDGNGGASFGTSLLSGDFNADGKTDLVVGKNKDKVYLFYNDDSIADTDMGADLIIEGEASSYFGAVLTSGDLNYDGREDLVVGAYAQNNGTGQIYVFYNDGSFPSFGSAADRIISGETPDGRFGRSLASGDFNADGRVDLVVGAYQYNSNQGRAYVFYSGTNFATLASEASLIITGEAGNNYFGYSLLGADLNADGKTDLIIGAYQFNSSQGRVYVFYNDGSMVGAADEADVIISGQESNNYFGYALSAGDLNSDTQSDLIISSFGYNSYQGRVYIFYSNQPLGDSASDAQVIVDGEIGAGSYFGGRIITGDFNADNKTDLAVGANNYSASYGRTYIFYNDDNLPTAAETADIIITGETTSNFGISLAGGDFNNDTKIDFVVGATSYKSVGKVYIFYSQLGQINIEGAKSDAKNNNFAKTLISGDLNYDGREDLIVGAHQFNSSQGRVYIFYNDGSIANGASNADAIITGEATNNNFGYAIKIGDLNNDNKNDLIVGANNFNNSQGRAYIFYNDGSLPNTASLADEKISGETTSNYFGSTLAVGDL
ncbi:MAG: FG-GAP-like repeat-containing protein, partial [Candidatus Moraniibacteriota bacterium]